MAIECTFWVTNAFNKQSMFINCYIVFSSSSSQVFDESSSNHSTDLFFILICCGLIVPLGISCFKEFLYKFWEGSLLNVFAFPLLPSLLVNPD